MGQSNLVHLKSKMVVDHLVTWPPFRAIARGGLLAMYLLWTPANADTCTDALSEPVLILLQQENEKLMPPFKHEIRIREGKAYIEIGYLHSDQHRFGGLLIKAIRKGLVAEIDAGFTKGPNVLALLLNIGSAVPKGIGLNIKGSISPAVLEEAIINRKQEIHSRFAKTGNDRFIYFSESDVASFYENSKRLKIEQACRSLFDTAKFAECHWMNFQFNAEDPNSIQWAKRRNRYGEPDEE
jgi:hypothetical protein